ncbi:MAG: GNAT family N-acetyltransferase [Rhodospirillaceae bacterium]|nr:GNAT family N-acetyltransferase [Rhodospirillaceae bacterium]
MTILETDRLLLRRFVPGDLDDLFALYSDPEVRRHFPEGVLRRDETQEELEWFLDGHPDHPELGLWATIHKPSGRFIGRCGLLPWMIEDRLETEVAYLLARDQWRQGLGVEIARGLVRYGFEQLNRPRLISLIDPENVASQRTAEKAGLAFEREIVLDDMRCRIYAAANPGLR